MPKLPQITSSTQDKINELALSLLKHGEAPTEYKFLGDAFKLQFDEAAQQLKHLDIKTTYGDLYPKEVEIAFLYLWKAMRYFHIRSFTDQNYFFSQIDCNSANLKNCIVRSGDSWGMIETKHLSPKFPMPWHSLDNVEIHIQQIIPGSINSSLWLSELLASITQEKIFIRPDIFRLMPVGTSSARLERAAMYGKPFKKEWLKNLKKIEIAEHAPDPSNPLEQGHRTQFIWEPLLSQKKIQFAIEELPDKDDDLVCTRFIHGIYDLNTDKFEHFDGAVHIYSSDEYKNRVTQHLKMHNNNYMKAKIFLIDSGISLEQGEKLISAFYRWNTMPIEYFTQG